MERLGPWGNVLPPKVPEVQGLPLRQCKKSEFDVGKSVRSFWGYDSFDL